MSSFTLCTEVSIKQLQEVHICYQPASRLEKAPGPGSKCISTRRIVFIRRFKPQNAPNTRKGRELKRASAFSPKTEVGEHTRPRVWLDSPRGQSLRAARSNNALEKSARPEFSARARKTAPEGGCAPHATSEFGFSRCVAERLLAIVSFSCLSPVSWFPMLAIGWWSKRKLRFA